MNIIFYSTLNLFEDMIAQVMELAKIEKEKGHTIYFIGCNSSIDYCSMVSKGDKNYHACIACQYKQRAVLKDFGVDEKNIYFMKPTSLEKNSIERYKNIKEITDYKYKDINIGIGIASSLISYTRDTDVDLDENRDIFNDMFKTAHTVLDNIEIFFEEIKPDKVYIYNGRLVEYRTVLEYCKHKNIPFTTYEVGSTIQKYMTFDNTLPHDIQLNGQFALQLAKNNSKEVIEKGAIWYVNRRKGSVSKDKIDISYIKNQKKNNLPKSFETFLDTNKHIISIFNSSEDEIASVGQDIWKTYGRQSDIIEEIVKEFENTDSNYFFYLRIHPNQQPLIHVKEVQKMISLSEKYSNIEVILPNEDIDTYTLMEKSHKVLSFGSTTGIEATFWQKPSIVYGSAFYKYIPNSAYFPNSFEELINTLRDKQVEPLSKEAAIIYGYYISERGTDLKYYKDPLFVKKNRFESKQNFIYFYLKLYNFLINNRFPMRFFPKKIVYNLFLKK